MIAGVEIENGSCDPEGLTTPLLEVICHPKAKI